MAIRIKRLLTDFWPPTTPMPDQFPQPLYDEIRLQFGALGCRFLVAEDQELPEKILGCGGIAPLAPGICEIRRLVVAPPFQRHGVGQRLLTFLMKEALDLKYQKMRVQFPADIESLRTFYARNGFVPIPPYTAAPNTYLSLELDLSTIELIPNQ